MATEQVVEGLQWAAYCGSVSLVGKLHYIMKHHTDGTILIAAAATDKLIGVLREEGAVGKPVTIQTGGVAKVIAGGSIAYGDLITSDGSGKGVATTSATNRYIGFALGAADTNDIFEVYLAPGLI